MSDKVKLVAKNAKAANYLQRCATDHFAILQTTDYPPPWSEKQGTWAYLAPIAGNENVHFWVHMCDDRNFTVELINE